MWKAYLFTANDRPTAIRIDTCQEICQTSLLEIMPRNWLQRIWMLCVCVCWDGRVIHIYVFVWKSFAKGLPPPTHTYTHKMHRNRNRIYLVHALLRWLHNTFLLCFMRRIYKCTFSTSPQDEFIYNIFNIIV